MSIPSLKIVAQMVGEHVWTASRPDMCSVAYADVVSAAILCLQLGNLVLLVAALAIRECFAEQKLVKNHEALQSTRRSNGLAAAWSAAPRSQRRSDYHWRPRCLGARGLGLYLIVVLDGFGRNQQPNRSPGAGQHFFGAEAWGQRSETCLADNSQHIPQAVGLHDLAVAHLTVMDIKRTVRSRYHQPVASKGAAVVPFMTKYSRPLKLLPITITSRRSKSGGAVKSGAHKVTAIESALCDSSIGCDARR